MGYREKTIEHLYRILAKNYQDGRVYKNAAENSRKLHHKNFFQKLALQKKSFCKRIKKEIEKLQQEIHFLGEEAPVRNNWKDKNSPILPVFRSELDGLIKECYRREKQNVGMYNNMLSKISMGQIREMLLFQKHSLQLIINEIEALGLRIYDEKDENFRYDLGSRRVK
ncbi:hypothetical protein FHG64_13490 [Antarcticibacterium flavum]|uniref:DUF2383 domain-containing protein n=1 Tax=Antarcticibacterium flavum TaxID=2058175 RepID=A0A5B7X4H0_9FLAO|nr:MULTISPECIES: hypothetical protein [Antarcticibacterium]MCM4158594.1 hypothetical protein [Antarcticibacterium sp. W02-3]QCY70336.1 hypothetical protein FHG64_13490 [Antarcticibacterium flavum]